MATITCLYAKIYAEIHSDTGTLGRLGLITWVFSPMKKLKQNGYIFMIHFYSIVLAPNVMCQIGRVLTLFNISCRT